MPVIDLYKQFGKGRWIDAFGSVNEVFEMTKAAMLPQVFFIIGPKCAGKTALGGALGERCNMMLFNFHKFVIDSGLKGRDDETLTKALIKQLRNEINPRILIEDFP